MILFLFFVSCFSFCVWCDVIWCGWKVLLTGAVLPRWVPLALTMESMALMTAVKYTYTQTLQRSTSDSGFLMADQCQYRMEVCMYIHNNNT